MKYRLRVLVLLGLICCLMQPAFSQADQSKPRLVVGIMIDGLQQRHIDQLWTRFEGNGFKKIVSQGANFKRLACNIVASGNTADIVTLGTGTVPYYHGVISNTIYNRNNGMYESVFLDRSKPGIQTDLTVSAKNILATTFVDELMLAGNGKSKSYVVGINPEDAIALGGHASNCVVWIDDADMNWGSTSYYPGRIPWQAMEMNVSGNFQRYVSRVWNPLFVPSTYIAVPMDSVVVPFEYLPSALKNNRFKNTILKTTPSANSLVADLGLRIILEEKLGVDNHPDVMMLQFTVRTPNEKKFSLNSVEKEDMYLRLDRELQFLMQKVESAVGLQNVLFYVYGNQTATYSPEELKAKNISAGYFNANRSMALLNSYLMALYGQEKWIQGYYGKNIFLNRKKIEERNISFTEFQKVVSEFIVEFEGVQSAHSYIQLMNLAPNPASDIARVRNSVHRKTAGDIIITLMPGWLELDDFSHPVGESNDLISYIPFYMYGWKVQKQVVQTAYQITDVASTLSRFLQIPYPNANLGTPMELIFNDK